MSIFPAARPLDEAARRLRLPSGRPRKVTEVNVSGATTDVSVRLLDVARTAVYLAVSPWTVRDLEAAGTLRRIRIPLSNGGELRKLLFDRADLDELIGRWKDGAAR